MRLWDLEEFEHWDGYNIHCVDDIEIMWNYFMEEAFSHEAIACRLAHEASLNEFSKYMSDLCYDDPRQLERRARREAREIADLIEEYENT